LAGAKLQSSRLRPETYFVSVIVPTHDRHDLVGRAIRSVLCQTYRSWELIIVNDGSTDRTAEVLSSYGDDPRIRVMHLDPARGGAAARNVGLDLATGELIAFLDDDDVWLPTKLEKQVALLDSRSDVDIVSCNFLRVGDASSSIVRIDGEYTAREIMAFNVLAAGDWGYTDRRTAPCLSRLELMARHINATRTASSRFAGSSCGIRRHEQAVSYKKLAPSNAILRSFPTAALAIHAKGGPRLSLGEAAFAKTRVGGAGGCEVCIGKVGNRCLDGVTVGTSA
jgi:glycosyltransferase involved in cell wall biosynthesis